MTRQLYRSDRDKMLAGVCGGLGDYFDIDPVIFRAIFIFSTIGAGAGIIVYIVLWIIVPEETKLYMRRGAAAGREATTENAEGAANAENGEFQTPPGYGNRRSRRVDPQKRKSDAQTVWALVLISLGVSFLLHNMIPWLHFGHLWPLLLIAIGAFLLWKNIRDKKSEENPDNIENDSGNETKKEEL